MASPTPYGQSTQHQGSCAEATYVTISRYGVADTLLWQQNDACTSTHYAEVAYVIISIQAVADEPLQLFSNAARGTEPWSSELLCRSHLPQSVLK